MTLFTSLYTGVNGMNAQSKSTAAISTNIANMTTVGYKKTDIMFHDLVVNNTRPAKFQNGGVLSSNVQRIDKQGALKQTSFVTDMGISGQGFFAVKTQDDPAVEFLYTRNGTFSPDSEGVMRNAAGFILYGWPVDLNGNVMSGPTTASLQVVDVDEFDSQFRATTAGTLSANLNAAQEAVNPQFMGGALPVSRQSTWDPVLEISTDNSSAAHFVRNLTVYDNTGVPRELSFEYRKITGPMAQATSQTSNLTHLTSLTDPAFFGNINAGDMFTINAGADTQQYIIGAPIGAPTQVRVDTIGDLTNHLNSTFGGGTAVDASIDGSGRLVIKAIDPTAFMAFTNDGNDGTTPASLGIPLGTPPAFTGGTLNFGEQAGNPPLNYTAYADVTVNDPLINPNQSDFPPFANLTNPNTNGWWEVRVLKEPDPSNPTYIEVPPGSGILIPNPDPLAEQRIEISKGLINFDGTGQLNTPRDAFGNPVDGILTLNSGEFDTGPLVANENITVNIDIGRFSQFAGGYNVIAASQNGFEAGTLTGIHINTDGLVVASFTNGQHQNIYQIPLADFINPNGLLAMSGTVFAQTSDAGELTMLEAGTGGAGLIQAETIEESNVDLAEEFAHLIVSQRAFSANSRVVNTVDEMTQMLRQLKS